MSELSETARAFAEVWPQIELAKKVFDDEVSLVLDRVARRLRDAGVSVETSGEGLIFDAGEPYFDADKLDLRLRLRWNSVQPNGVEFYVLGLDSTTAKERVAYDRVLGHAIRALRAQSGRPLPLAAVLANPVEYLIAECRSAEAAHRAGIQRFNADGAVAGLALFEATVTKLSESTAIQQLASRGIDIPTRDDWETNRWWPAWFEVSWDGPKGKMWFNLTVRPDPDDASADPFFGLVAENADAYASVLPEAANRNEPYAEGHPVCATFDQQLLELHQDLASIDHWDAVAAAVAAEVEGIIEQVVNHP